MQTNIRNEIQGMKRIQLKYEDFIETGSFSNVYRYRIHNSVLAVQCFQDQIKAEEENATLFLLEIQRMTLNHPTIIQYYGIKQLDIEIIGAFIESYNGYVMFFQQCQLDLQKILGIVTKLQTKQIFNLLSQNINLQTFSVNLINSFNQPKPNVKSYFPSFKSDILNNNPLYPTIILALFEEQNIQLSKIHTQFNIQPEAFETEEFHKNCDNKGSTLVIMHSNEEPNSFFGGMVAPSWDSKDEYIADPVDKCSWLFKIEVTENILHLHQWKCIKKAKAIYGGPDWGPNFGYYDGLFYGSYYGQYLSSLPSNNEYYEKINLNDKTAGLLFQLKNEINCPQKVEREIMNENNTAFYLDSCEVFAIKK